MWSFRCALQLLACGFCKIPTARCFSECPLVVTAPQHGPYNPQTGAALLFAAWGNITKQCPCSLHKTSLAQTLKQTWTLSQAGRGFHTCSCLVVISSKPIP